jgi:hypothetical protein
MTCLPGGFEFLLILFIKVVETIKVFCAIKGFLGILNELGSDATPMTPRTIVGTLDFQIRVKHHKRETHTTRFCL